MTDFTDKEELLIEEPSEEDDGFTKLVLVEGYDPSEDRTFEYIALKKGYVEEVTLHDGTVGPTDRVTESTTLGSVQTFEALVDRADEFLDLLANGDGES